MSPSFRVSFFAIFFGGIFTSILNSTPALAIAPMTSRANSDSAEICTSTNGRYQVVRGFKPSETVFVEISAKAGEEPKIKPGIRFERESGGTSRRNEVSFDMFELMVEPLGGVPKARDEWKSAYEEHFSGRVKIYDETGKLRGILEMSCHAAILDFKPF